LDGLSKRFQGRTSPAAENKSEPILRCRAAIVPLPADRITIDVI